MKRLALLICLLCLSGGAPLRAQDAAPATGATRSVTLTLDASDVRVDGDASASAKTAKPKDPIAEAGGAVNTLYNSAMKMARGFIEHLPNLALALVVLVLTALVSAVAQKTISTVLHRFKLKESLRDLFRQLMNIAIWFFGLMLAAGIIFPDFGFTQVVAAAGLASIAIGFAFKDIFENFFAGILILWNYPFETGDFIEIEGHDIMGRVEDIWIRITLIRRVDGQLVIVPNSTIYTNPVRVLTSQPLRRVELICGVAYGEDVDASRTVIEGAVKSCALVNPDKPVQVFASEFGESSINFEVRWWAASTPVGQKQSKDQVVAAIKRALDDAGIEIPFPYRTLVFKKSDPFYAAGSPGED